ncbi:PadR family transcriptional regulator [Nocardia aurantia]|uniref:Transcription regulator PadR N-terminal domain-containing protein n=1 Tax=Nocardia aurantia TaxID=2585199 RepID=A0A7K0DKB8_9NOCA|nr:PadR family transcriptional regulator [Nocardia aurantia]MQY26246.1 hypothetical protein [Nocardia aurantia]
MSYVEVLILRHLMRGPAHGYDLRKHVEENTGVVLNNNALYPALRRFEEAGAVTKESEQSPGRPVRHVYTLTPTGRELLQDLLAELPPDQAATEAEFLTRAAHFAMLTVPERMRVLDARERAVRRQLDQVRGQAARTTPVEWGRRIAEEMVRRGEAELVWLAELRHHAHTEPVLPEGES